MKKNKLKTIVKELEGASKMHLRQSKEINKHVKDMVSQKSPLYQAMSCWDGYTAKGKKDSPSGKKTAGGNILKVNNCVKD